jgi:hypothetical protein
MDSLTQCQRGKGHEGRGRLHGEAVEPGDFDWLVDYKQVNKDTKTKRRGKDQGIFASH